MSLRLNANKIRERFHEHDIKEMKAKRGYNQKEVDKNFSKVPKILYKYEPFEFYGGTYTASR